MDKRLWDGIITHLEELGFDPLALFDAWKLGPGTGWENVAEHCLVEAGAHLVFAPICGYDEEGALLLARTALCHNLKKRAEKRPDEFSEEELLHAEQLLSAAEPSWSMVEEILNPKFLVTFVTEEVTMMERLLFIVDDMARDGDIVSFDDRIDEVSARNPDPEPAIREQLGRPYWDVERQVGQIILTGLLVELRAKGFKVATMNDIPRLINAEMNKKFIASDLF